MKKVIKHINTIAQDTVVIPKLGQNESLDRGQAATLNKRKHNTKVRNNQSKVGHTIHYDIAHGTGIAICGVK